MKNYLLFLFVFFLPLLSFTQENVKFDSISIYYRDFNNRVFYKYNIINNTIYVEGEEIYSKLIIVDQKKKTTSYYNETKQRDYSISNDKIIDSISSILNYLLINNNNYITEYSTERVESDKTIIDITCFYQGKTKDKRIILEPTEKYYDKFVDFLQLLKELRDMYRNISN
ncbi:MAG: hypothetical protein H6Q16_2087 [Bacteroidetes bacterium]|nr:hypothetical protein [Bacteroidota bacterium]